MLPVSRVESAPSEEPGRSGRGLRLPIIAVASLILVIAVVVALLGGRDDSSASLAAPERCLDAWNAAPDALAYGRHNFGSHGYERVEVAMLTEQAEEPAAEAKGVCAVIFGATQLDSEPIAAGQLLVDGIWVPIAQQPDVEINYVAELQAVAYGTANASLTGAGRLVVSAPAG